MQPEFVGCKGLLNFQPKFTNLVAAAIPRYKVLATHTVDGLHLHFSFMRMYDGSGYLTKKEAYAAAKKELEEKGQDTWAFLLKLDLGKEGE